MSQLRSPELTRPDGTRAALWPSSSFEAKGAPCEVDLGKPRETPFRFVGGSNRIGFVSNRCSGGPNKCRCPFSFQSPESSLVLARSNPHTSRMLSLSKKSRCLVTHLPELRKQPQTNTKNDDSTSDAKHTPNLRGYLTRL